MKKLLFLSLAVSAVFVSSVNGFANNVYASDENVFAESNTFDNEENSKQRMIYISDALSSINTSSNGTATVTALVNGYQGTTTSVSLVTNLKQYKNGSWVTIKSFNSSSKSYRISLSGAYNITKGYSYRSQTTVKAYSGSAVETRMVTSSTASY